MEIVSFRGTSHAEFIGDVRFPQLVRTFQLFMNLFDKCLNIQKRITYC